MVIALVGVAGWLLILTIAMSLAAAAKHGDELAQSARRYLPDSHTGAQLIPFDRALAAKRSEFRRAQPCRAPIQCRRSCTISSSSR
jgi:hypothetical protein